MTNLKEDREKWIQPGSISLVQMLIKDFVTYVKGLIHGEIKANSEKTENTTFTPVNFRKVGSSCSICPNVHSQDLPSFKEHFKCPWHVYNLRTRNSGGSSLSIEDYDNMFTNINSTKGEISSFDTEENESECMSENEESDEEEPLSPIEPTIGTSFIEFAVLQSGDKISRFRAQKSILYTYEEMIVRGVRPILEGSRILKTLEEHAQGVWIIFLIRSGRAAAGVFNNKSGNIIASKLFKRYTTRRKQGGSQSSKDSKGGRVKSAGANIRRKNEQHLIEDVQALIKEWKKYFEQAGLIFWNDSETARGCIFTGDSCKMDSRWRTIPCTTYRPSLEELIRCYFLLYKLEPVDNPNKESII